MKIYLDLLLIQDTIVMSFLLYAMSKIINIKISMVRVLTISFVSSILSILLLVYLPTLYGNLFIKCLLSFAIVKYGFQFKQKNTILQKVILFWIITFLTGGTIIALEGNLFLVCFALVTSMIAIMAHRKKYQSQLLLESATCFLEFEYHGKEYQIKALVDTGHDVQTRYGEDVIFIKENILEMGGDKTRLVSYKTISGMENRYGVKVNDIKIKYGNTTICSNAVIVSSPNIAQNHDAIVGYHMIGGMTNGNINANEAKSKKVVSRCSNHTGIKQR